MEAKNLFKFILNKLEISGFVNYIEYAVQTIFDVGVLGSCTVGNQVDIR